MNQEAAQLKREIMQNDFALPMIKWTDRKNYPEMMALMESWRERFVVRTLSSNLFFFLNCVTAMFPWCGFLLYSTLQRYYFDFIVRTTLSIPQIPYLICGEHGTTTLLRGSTHIWAPYEGMQGTDTNQIVLWIGRRVSLTGWIGKCGRTCARGGRARVMRRLEKGIAGTGVGVTPPMPGPQLPIQAGQFRRRNTKSAL